MPEPPFRRASPCWAPGIARLGSCDDLCPRYAGCGPGASGFRRRPAGGRQAAARGGRLGRLYGRMSGPRGPHDPRPRPLWGGAAVPAPADPRAAHCRSALASGPARARSVLVGAVSSLSVLAAAGAMATALALAGAVHRFGDVYRLLDPGVVGAGLLLLAQVAYLPNAVLWAIAYMLGPGFAVGAGTVAGPSGSVLGPMPAFPLLAALPAGSHGSGPGWLASLMLAVPYLAGAAGGVLVARIAPTSVLESAPIRGFCCGLLSGIVLGVVAAFACGPVRHGRLAVLVPSPWQLAAGAAPVGGGRAATPR